MVLYVNRPGSQTLPSCPTCGTVLTLVIDCGQRQTYWRCPLCNPAQTDGGGENRGD